MLQNPSLRKAYEEVNFKTDSASNGSGKKTSDKPSVFIVTNKSPISGQIEYMEAAKLHVQSNEAVTLLPSLKVSGMFETLSNFYWTHFSHFLTISRVFSYFFIIIFPPFLLLTHLSLFFLKLQRIASASRLVMTKSTYQLSAIPSNSWNHSIQTVSLKPLDWARTLTLEQSSHLTRMTMFWWYSMEIIPLKMCASIAEMFVWVFDVAVECSN